MQKIFALALLLSLTLAACQSSSNETAAEETAMVEAPSLVAEPAPPSPSPPVEVEGIPPEMAEAPAPMPAAPKSQRAEPRRTDGQPSRTTEPTSLDPAAKQNSAAKGGTQSIPPSIATGTKENPTPPQTADNQPAKPRPESPPITKEDPGPPSHSAWDALLRQYVTADGKVNYAGMKSDRTKLESYLQTLLANPPQDSWGRNEKLAYWINTYNAFTVKLIVDNYPTASITKLEGGKPWDRKWIRIGGQTYSLNNIENDIIRPRFNEPRIHFAVNCAAKSCPPLLNRAWTAGNLESNFEKQTRAFVNNPAFNSISAKKVEVSKIFDWYGKDFGKLIDFLNKYSNTKINANAKVEFREYDWDLNGQ